MTEHHQADSAPAGEKQDAERPRSGSVLGVKASPERRNSNRVFLDPAQAAVVVGSAIALIGWIDVALAWVPFQFGEVQWEFGTISRTFDGLPLATLGLGAVLGGLMSRGAGRVASWLAALIVGLALCLLLVLAVMYVTNAVAAWDMSGPGVRGTLKRAYTRTGMFAGIYLATYGWMTWIAIRMVRSQGKGRKAW